MSTVTAATTLPSVGSIINVFSPFFFFFAVPTSLLCVPHISEPGLSNDKVGYSFVLGQLPGSFHKFLLVSAGKKKKIKIKTAAQFDLSVFAKHTVKGIVSPSLYYTNTL